MDAVSACVLREVIAPAPPTSVQPSLTTQRLVLRPARAADVDALWVLWTDPEVRRFLWDDRVIGRDEAASVLDDCLALAPRGLGLWCLERAAMGDAAAGPEQRAGERAGELLGCAGLLPVRTAAELEPRLAGLVEPLVALTPRFWHRGYAQEALRALLEHAATTLGLARLAGVTDVPNVASDRMLRRAGFVPIGEAQGPVYRFRSYLWEAPRAPGRARGR